MAEKILIVDDEPDIREVIGDILSDEGYTTRQAANAEQAREQKSGFSPDLILLDVWMPDSDGISLLKEWRANNELDCPVVMISGHGTVETAVEATRNGAVDFIEKPVSMARLLITIKNALDKNRAGPDPGQPSGNGQHALVPLGRSAAVEALRQQIDRIARLDSHVFIVGEPGSGRTNLGCWIHQNTTQIQGPLLTVGGIDDFDELLESGLQQRNAAAGTLLLDPFDWIWQDPDAENAGQQLLRWMDANPNWRVMATTMPGIEQHVQENTLDPALFHRIDELRLLVPALRDRREDIPELVRHFSEHIPIQKGLGYRHFPVAVQNRLRQHDWPGNLRELANLVQQLLLNSDQEEVSVDEVEQQLRQHSQPDENTMVASHSPLFDLPLREARETFERQYLIARLRQVGGSVGQLAEAVEMERTHLYRKLRQLGIDPKQIQEQR